MLVERLVTPGLPEQLLGPLGVVKVVLDLVVVGPQGGRQRVLGDPAGALEHCVDDRFLVHREVERLAHPGVGERFLLGVEPQIAHVQPLLLQDLDVGMVAHRLEVGGVRVGDHVALAGLQLLPAHGGVRRDGEDQVVERRLAFPVLGMGLIADDRVFLIGLELERPGADRLEVEPLGRPRRAHLVGVLRRQDRGEIHRQDRQEGGVRRVQLEAHRVLVDFLGSP